MTDTKLQGLLRFWQKAIRLQDWRIVAGFVGKASLNRGDLARTWVNVELKQAVVKVLREEDLAEVGPMNLDIEETLVHELMHLHCQQLYNRTRDKRQDREFLEQLVEQVAIAMIGLKRGI